MIRLEIYDGSKTYMFPSGKIADPTTVKNDYPAVDVFPHVIEVNGNVLQSISELGALRGIHGISEDLSDSEALVAMENIINTPPDDPGPSVEERIAAALEFQNIQSM